MFKVDIYQYTYWEEKANFLLSSDVCSEWVLYLIENGSCSFNIDGNQGIARCKNLLLCPPYKIFEREVREKLTFHFFRFSFEEDASADQAFKKVMEYPLAISNKDRIQNTIALLNKIPYDASDFCNAYRVSLLTDLLFSAYQEKYDPSISRFGPDYKEPYIHKAIRLLAVIGDGELSISEIAQELSLNPSYFARKFRAITDHSPVDYRNKLRIKRSQKLLIETDMTLDEIAEECGFSNGFYLSRIFTKYIGISPGKFRKQHTL